MDSIANDSLEGELSPDDLNVSKASTGSNKSGKYVCIGEGRLKVHG